MSNTIYNDQIKVNCPLVCDENGYYHLIYQVTNKQNGKIYIGKHSTKDPYDCYLGSGKAIKLAIEKYKRENFIKEILYCFTTDSEAFLKEEEIVTQEFVNREDTYNMMLGGKGLSSGENNPWYGKHLPQEIKEKLSKSAKERCGEKNSFYGKTHSQETREKLSSIKKGKPLNQETRDKISKSLKGRPSPQKGKHLSKETREKQSKSLKGKTRSQETRDKYSKAKQGAKHPQAKAVLKLDTSGNIITEYGTIKECCAQEQISGGELKEFIKEHTLYNGFYFEFKHKID